MTEGNYKIPGFLFTADQEHLMEEYLKLRTIHSKLVNKFNHLRESVEFLGGWVMTLDVSTPETMPETDINHASEARVVVLEDSCEVLEDQNNDLAREVLVLRAEKARLQEELRAEKAEVGILQERLEKRRRCADAVERMFFKLLKQKCEEVARLQANSGEGWYP